MRGVRAAMGEAPREEMPADPQVLATLRAAVALDQHGTLPFPGGWADQPARTMAGVEVVLGERRRILDRRAEAERVRAELRRKVRGG